MSRALATRSRRLHLAVDAAAVLGLTVVAFVEAQRVTAGLELPPDPDLFRSAAITQTILDGAWTGDPYFAGEMNWYNPLVPAMVAALHAVTGVPVLELYARGGPLLNLLVPLAFWALARRLFGSGVAVAATFVFLFLPPRALPGWSTAGYWPWLFSGVFTQAVFYAGLLAVERAGGTTRPGRWLLAGLALGLVFLGHTAPALLFGGTLVLTAARAWRRGCPPGRSALLLTASLAVACLVSAPLVLSVAVRYRFAVRNDVLALWAFPDTEPANLPGLLRDHVTAGGVLALLGLALIVFDRERRERAWVIAYWGAVNGLFLLAHFGRGVLESVGLRAPQVVTAFHFVLYAEALLMLLGGYALWRLVELAATLVPRPAGRMTPGTVARVLLLAIVVPSVRPALPNRRAREDFDESRARALSYQGLEGHRGVREWIRANAEPGSVFLSPEAVAVYVVGPAGGKVVSADPVFANPYVDVATRDGDRLEMEDRIRRNDRAGYCVFARRYGVRYAIVEVRDGVLPVPAPTFLEHVFEADGMHVFRSPDCGPDSAGNSP